MFLALIYEDHLLYPSGRHVPAQPLVTRATARTSILEDRKEAHIMQVGTCGVVSTSHPIFTPWVLELLILAVGNTVPCISFWITALQRVDLQPL